MCFFYFLKIISIIYFYIFLTQFSLLLCDLLLNRTCVVILQDKSLLPSRYLLHFRLTRSILQKKKPDYLLLIWPVFQPSSREHLPGMK